MASPLLWSRDVKIHTLGAHVCILFPWYLSIISTGLLLIENAQSLFRPQSLVRFGWNFAWYPPWGSHVGQLRDFWIFDLRGPFFVRDGIHSVADYNSTLMGVVVVVVVVVVRFFHDGITQERLELSS